MEQNNYRNDFEHFLREGIDEFRMVPQRKVWYSIYNHMHPDRKWPSIAVCLIILVAILHIGISNNNDISKSVTASKNQIADLNKEQTPAFLKQKETLGNFLASNNSSSTKPIASIEPIVENLKNNTATSSNISIQNTNTVIHKRVKTNLDNVAEKIENQTTNYVSLQTIKNSYKNNTPILSSQQNNTNISDIVISRTTDITNPTIKLNSQTNNSTTQSPLTDDLANNKTEGLDQNTILLNSSNTNQTKLDSKNKQDESKKMNSRIEENNLKNLSESLVKNQVKITVPKENNSISYYVTPSYGFRNLVSTRTNKASNANNFASVSPAYTVDPFSGDENALNLELGAVLEHMVNNNIRIKGGLQVNYTNYISKASELDHPIQNALAVGTNQNYLSSMSYSSKAGNINLNKSSLQISVPLGFDYKLVGSKKIKWYVGATVQPSYILAGSAYLLSADNENYSNEKSFIRRLNVNTAIETFISIKTAKGIVLNVGPQLRYQLFSSYKNTYNYKENLYNLGVKVAVTTSF